MELSSAEKEKIMIQCPYGHHYDDKIYNECPWCKRIDSWEKDNGQGREDSNHTVFMFDESSPDDRTVLLMEDEDDDQYERTVLLYDDIETPLVNRRNQLRESEFMKLKENEAIPALLTGWLVYVNGNRRGTAITLGKEDTLLGLDANREVIVLEEKELSQAYAVISYESINREFHIKPGKKRCLFYAGDNAVYNRNCMKAREMVEMGESKLIFIPFCSEDFDWSDE